MTQNDDDRLAALVQRVADLEELHAAELAEIRGARERAARKADGSAAADEARNEQRSGALATLRLKCNGLSGLGFPLHALREVLKIARAVMESDATPVRNTLPAVVTAIERVQKLAAEAPEVAWPEAVELLRDAECMRDDATAALAAVDRRLAEQEQMRRRRLESGAAR